MLVSIASSRLLVWLVYHSCYPTLMAEDLDVGMVQDTHPKHVPYQAFSEPSDFGFGGLARMRTWLMCAHKDLTTCLHDPFELLEMIKSECQKHQTDVGDYLIATKHEIVLESQELAQRRGICFRAFDSDLTYLLTTRELETKQALDVKYHQKKGVSPETDPNLVYFLGDSASYGASWSANSKRIPTFRRNAASGVFWLPAHRRFLTQKERLVAMGWPCCTEVARSLQVPLFGASDVRRASDLLGNAMHYQSAAILQLVALSCFGPSDEL